MVGIMYVSYQEHRVEHIGGSSKRVIEFCLGDLILLHACPNLAICVYKLSRSRLEC